MQNYIEIAQKNGIILMDKGRCQFYGHTLPEVFTNVLKYLVSDFKQLIIQMKKDYFYRFLTLDAHTLQHSEIHGPWNNYFHLTRQHLIYTYHLDWNYTLSPKLSAYLNDYKKSREDGYLKPPPLLNRGNITTTDILRNSTNETECIEMIIKWGKNVYKSWKSHHVTIDFIAKGFIDRNKGQLPTSEHKI